MKEKSIFGAFDINKDFSYVINPNYFYHGDDTHFGLLIKIKTNIFFNLCLFSTIIIIWVPPNKYKLFLILILLLQVIIYS